MFGRPEADEFRAPKARRREPGGGLNCGGAWIFEPWSGVIGEDTSDNGFGKKRDPVDLGMAESMEGVVEVAEGGTDPPGAPFEAEANMDNKARGPSEACCGVESLVVGLGEDVPFDGVSEI